MAKTTTVHAQQRWEYTHFTRRTQKALGEDMNQLGQDGWELVTITFGKDFKGEVFWTAFMKRPAAAQAASTTAEAPAAKAADPEPAPPPAEEQPAEEDGAFDLSGDEFDIRQE
ncbi:MAG: hypothetical protein ACYTG0_29995 [Planctomycetota bacterium]|jgi:hypothetical protein